MLKSITKNDMNFLKIFKHAFFIEIIHYSLSFQTIEFEKKRVSLQKIQNKIYA